MSNHADFIKELSRHLGQQLSASNEDMTHTLQVEGEDLFLRCIPEENQWVYFGFVTDFMSEVSPEQLEKALELNLFGRGTAGFHLGLIGKALALSGSFPLEDPAAERLAEQIVQLSHLLAPLHRDLTSTEEATIPLADDDAENPEDDEPTDISSPDEPDEENPFSLLNHSFLRI